MNPIKFNHVNILIVDDDATCTFIAQQALRGYFNVDTVSNGYEALKFLETKTYDVILMDINLGDERMDGIRTMRQIKNIRKHKRTLIYAVTVYLAGKDWLIKQGFDGLFAKPVSDKQMVKEILEQLELQKPCLVNL